MKKNLTLIIVCAFAFCNHAFSQNTFPATGSVGIGTSTPNSSSLLEIKSTTKGILIPRMTKVQRDAIASPTSGLLIYQTNSSPGFYYYSGSAWSALKVNSVKGLNDNVFIGLNAGTGNTIGTGNIALGKGALQLNNEVIGNIAIGDSANYACVGQNYYFGSVAIGYKAMRNNTADANVGIGYYALTANTTGVQNTAVGTWPLYQNTTGTANTAFGYRSMSANTTGSYNTAVGNRSLYGGTGDYNTAVGNQALANNSSGGNNTAVGCYSLLLNTTGHENTAVGTNALYANTTGYGNTAVGNLALNNNTTGNENISVGFHSMLNNKTGVFNVAIGPECLMSNTVGSSNIAIGEYAMFAADSGYHNIAIGTHSLEDNKAGNNNIACGFYSLTNNTTGSNNIALGANTLVLNQTGSNNIGLGNGTLTQTLSGTDNVAIGNQSMYNNVTGILNVALGNQSGYIGTANLNNTYIGYDANNSTSTNYGNATALGNASRITANSQVRIGNANVSSIGGYVDWSNISDGRYKKNIKENVKGLEFIRLLRPVTYNLNVTGLNVFLNINDSVNKAGVEAKEKELQTGFIAQEVEAAAKKTDYDFSGVDKPKNENDLYGLRYAEFTVPLVKAVQELDKENQELKKSLIEMQQQLNALTNNQKISSQNISQAQLTITPNPTNDIARVTITSPDKNQALVLKITDASGKLIHTENVKGNSVYEFNTSSLSKGNYLVQLCNQNEILQSQKLIVQ
ncbi:MAG: tail fiber domain-containing protein [Bacteroidia bacterium]